MPMKKDAPRSSIQQTCCAIYARGATVKKPDQHNSISRQVAKCKRFAKENGWIVWEDCIFTDSGKSGLKVNSGLKDLIRVAASNPKPFEVLLCTATDRIARDTSIVNRIYETLTKCGVDIRFVGPWPSPALKQGHLICHVKEKPEIS
jgi:DNA invertase Pin-like site-specific DNA recombinase